MIDAIKARYKSNKSRVLILDCPKGREVKLIDCKKCNHCRIVIGRTCKCSFKNDLEKQGRAYQQEAYEVALPKTNYFY